MNAISVMPADLSKELRALLPLWIGCIVIVWAGGYHDLLFHLGLVTYLLGSAALGALSIGHEYTSRTLPLLLSSPVSRRRMFTVKAGVLIPMLIVLATIATVRLPVAPAGREIRDTALVGTLVVLSSAFLAPWLTMVCRNVIAAAVFALSIPAMLLVGSELISMWVYGLPLVDTAPAVHFRMQVLWSAMIVLSAIGAVASWRTFVGLETLEGSQSEVRLPRWLRRDETRRSVTAVQPTDRIISLVRKELHLQKMVFVVSALYITGWVAMLLVHRLAGRLLEEPWLVLTVVHAIVVALLSGSLASAEERHLGVLESQLLMPLSTTIQWAIKVTVVYGVCIFLTIILPAALMLVSPFTETIRFNVPQMVVVFVAATVSLYVSSLSTSGVKALLVAGPATVWYGVGVRLIADAVFEFVRPDPGHLIPPIGWLLLLLMAMMLLLPVGLTNHRSADRSASRIWRQVLWMSAATTLGSVMLAVIFRGRL